MVDRALGQSEPLIPEPLLQKDRTSSHKHRRLATALLPTVTLYHTSLHIRRLLVPPSGSQKSPAQSIRVDTSLPDLPRFSLPIYSMVFFTINAFHGYLVRLLAIPRTGVLAMVLRFTIFFLDGLGRAWSNQLSGMTLGEFDPETGYGNSEGAFGVAKVAYGTVD